MGAIISGNVRDRALPQHRKSWSVTRNFNLDGKFLGKRFPGVASLTFHAFHDERESFFEPLGFAHALVTLNSSEAD